MQRTVQKILFGLMRSRALRSCLLSAACLCAGVPGHSGAREQTPVPVTIHVDTGRVLNQISPWMTEACIEDVNHEIYGGLYAQKLFGESFEEPPPPKSSRTGRYSGGTGDRIVILSQSMRCLAQNWCGTVPNLPMESSKPMFS